MPKIKTKEDLIRQTHITEEEMLQANNAISIAYILNSLANEYSDICADILNKRGMNLGRIKFVQNNLFAAFNRYHTEIKTIIVRPEAGSELVCEYDKLGSLIKNYLDDPPANWNWQLRYYMIEKLYNDLKKENESLKNGNL